MKTKLLLPLVLFVFFAKALFAAAPAITSFSPSSGPVGTLVTITGTHLDNLLTFSIGGTAAIPISNSATQLVGMVMPGAVSGAVSLTTSGGATSGGSNFTVTNTPFPGTQTSELVAGDTGGLHGFGISVALSADGSTAIVGSFIANSRTGAAYIFTKSGASWTQQAELTGSNGVGTSFQGSSVAISADGNTAIIGGPSDNSSIGASWVFGRSGTVWTEQAELLANDNTSNAGQGTSVALSADGNTALVGGPGDNSSAGAAWVYRRSQGFWNQWGSKLVGTGEATAGQGKSVALSADGKTAVIGGPVANSSQGAVWVFTTSGATWTQQGGELIGTGGAGSTSSQGSSVAVSADGNTLADGGSSDNASIGAIWVFTRSSGNWAQQGNKLVGTGISGARSFQGLSVSISADGNTLFESGTGDNNSLGAAWLFTRSGGAWTQQGNKLLDAGFNGPETESDAVAISADGSTGIIGGIGDRTNGGAAFIFAAAQPATLTFTPSSGPVGTLVSVTVTGLDVSNLSSLTIGGTPAIIVSHTATQVVALVMPGTISGNISVTAPGGTGTSTGIFTVTPTVFPSVQQDTKFTGTGNTGDAAQGISIAVSADGNTAIFGGYRDNNGVGAAWIYTRIGSVWIQQGGKLVGTGSVGAAAQGHSVAISPDGNTAIVGGSLDNNGQGAVWVYRRSNGVWQLGPKIGITDNIGPAQFGNSVGLSADGNKAIIGGNLDNSQQGAAWVLTYTGGLWLQQGNKLTVIDNIGPAQFGKSVAISANGTTAIIGGTADDSNQGAAWIFALVSGFWQQVGKFNDSQSLAAQMGSSVALSADGKTALVGGFNDNSGVGATWVYSQGAFGYEQQGSKLIGTGNTGAAGQGYAVALSADGNTAVIGGPNDNTQQGAIWVFTRAGTNWTQRGVKLVGTDNTGEAEQGTAVALSADGTTAVEGGPADNDSEGAFWVFTVGNAPTISATNLAFTDIQPNSATVSWHNGNGTGRSVFIAKASTGSALPADNMLYTANAAFAAGTQIGSTGWYCIYNGMGSTVDITGLLPGTTYRVTTVEFNGTLGGQSYLTSNLAPANVTTILSAPTVQAMHVNFTNTTGTSTTANWTNGNGSARAVFMSKTADGAAFPMDDTTYLANTRYGLGDPVGTTAWRCIYNGTGTSVDITGLSPGKTYRVTVVEYNNAAGSEQYLLSRLSPANVATIPNRPTVPALNLTFRNITTNTADVLWRKGNGRARAVFVKQGADGAAVPDDLTTYTANATFGNGSQIGATGWYCVYNGSGSGAPVSGLLAGTTYRVTVVEYDGDTPGVEQYLTTGQSPASVTTLMIAPTVPARNIVFSNTTGTTTTASWTNGNGTARAVFVAQGSSGHAAPADNHTYTANNHFEMGTQAGAGWFCVYNGTGSGVNIIGLKAGFSYRVTVVEYNTVGVQPKYATTGLSPANVATPTLSPTIPSMNLTFSAKTTSAFKVSWTKGNGKDRAVFVKQGADGAALPVDLTTYTRSTTFGAGTQIGASGWYCVANGSGSSADVAGLTPGTTYRVTVVEYNGAAGAEIYSTTGLSPANATTQLVTPTVSARLLTFTNTTNTSTTLSWTSGNGIVRAAFIRKGQDGAALPADNTFYTANTTFGQGDQVGAAPWYCIYNGTGSTVNISGLTPGTIYRVTVVEYNSVGGNPKYLETGLSPADVTTTGVAPLNNLYLPGTGQFAPLVSSFSNQKVEVNNILSPNGDGINDIWVIKNIAFYPNNLVTIYDRAGKVIFTKKNYENDWAGGYRGGIVADGTYYYSIDLGNGAVVRGFVTVVK